jgi:hypothetical protein
VLRRLDPRIALIALVCACTAPASVERCTALAATCGGDRWEAWCRSACVPRDARTRPCDAPDVCAFCNADGSLFTFASGCAPTPTSCDDTNPCPIGTSTWTGRGGACLPSEPCAGDTACHALGRACVTTLGVASCGRCLDDLADRDGACVETTPDFVGPYRVGRDHFSVWDGAR